MPTPRRKNDTYEEITEKIKGLKVGEGGLISLCGDDHLPTIKRRVTEAANAQGLGVNIYYSHDRMHGLQLQYCLRELPVLELERLLLAHPYTPKKRVVEEPYKKGSIPSWLVYQGGLPDSSRRRH